MSTQTVFGVSSKIEEAEQEIAKREKEIQALREQLDTLKAEPLDTQLARELHDMLCTWNHTDGCGWFYEMKNKQDDWGGNTHGEYLNRARRLMMRCDHEGVELQTALKFYHMVKGDK